MVKIFLLITLIFLTNTNFSYAQSNKPIAQNQQEDLLVKVHRYQNLHNSILNDPSLSLDEKIFFIIDSLGNAIKDLSQQEFKFVVTDIDKIIFLESNDQKIIKQQVNFLGYYSSSRDAYWPFSKSREEVQVFFKNNLVKLRSDSDSTFYNLYEEMVKIGELANESKFDEALHQLEVFESALKKEGEKPDNYFYRDHELAWSKLFPDGIRFRIFFEMGDLKNASIYADKTDKSLQLIIENKDKNPRDKTNFEDARKWLESMTYYFQYDLKIGKYDRVINRATQIISAFEINYNDLDEIRIFSNINETLSKAYFAKGDDESLKKGEIYFYAHLDLNKRSPKNDMAWLVGQIQTALEANDQEKFKLNLLYYDTSNALNDKATQVQYNELKKIYLDNTKTFFKANNFERSKALKRLWIELALHLDRGIYLNLDDAGMPIFTMGYYKNIYDLFIRASEKEIAASYAKKYINTLQNFRKQLRDYDKKDFIFLTESNGEYLKQFASNFYDISDYKSSLACMRILKENDFLDFVRRSNENENFLTNLDYTPSEKDYFAKLELLADQINILNKSNKNDLSILSKIEEKKREFIEAQNSYKKLTQNSLRVNSTKLIPQKNILNLSKNEAALIFSINPNMLEIQFHESNQKPLMFRSSFDNTKFQVKVLSIQKNLSLNRNVSEGDWSDLSSLLFVKPSLKNGQSLADFLKNKKFTKIKFQTDGYLNLIPFSLIPLNGNNFGSFYTTEKIGLSNKNKSDADVKLGLDAFGATKGNSEFRTNLPGVKNEIEKIMEAGVNTKNKRQFIDEQFNKLSFYNSFENNTALIHLATHFKIGTSLSEPSKMLLGDGSILTLDEIRSTIKPISTSLLTLSACNTGDSIASNLIKSNEGLSSIFQLKGAKNVVSTLWEIDDQATADFMTIFYSILFNNELSPSEALFYTQNIYRTGTLEFIKPGLKLTNDNINNKILANISKYKQPYYWAAFQISSIN